MSANQDVLLTPVEKTQNVELTVVEEKKLDIFTLISDNELLKDLLDKYSIKIPPEYLNKIVIVLKNLDNEKSIKPIVDVLLNVFADGKLEMYEIPLLVKVFSENITKLKIRKISSEDIGVLIKLLIIILVDLKVLKINNNDINILIKVLDYCLELLHFQIDIKNNCFTKCFSK